MEFENIESVLKELDNTHYPSGPLYQIIHGYKSLINKEQDEITTIYHLSETHSPELRHRAIFRYEKILIKEDSSNQSISRAKDNLAFECSTFQTEKSVEKMLQHIAEMPKEWTVVQMTPLYRREAHLNGSNDKHFTGTINISVFECGQNKNKPFMVVAKAPVDSNGSPIELAQEMQSIIKGNKEVLMSFNKQKVFKSQQEKTSYLSRRHSIEDRLKLLVKDIQGLWLKEWRCLLTGNYIDENVDREVKSEIIKFCASLLPNHELSHKTLYILCCLVKASFQLKLMEMKSGVGYCFPNADKKLVVKVVQFIRNLWEQLCLKAANTKKHPVILVLHDTLDAFPWEMMDVLQDESVTRVPSIHFLYCLFKEHQHNIQDGYKIIRDFDKGAYVVNPDGDLKNMEVRMMTFFNYWTPRWTGTSGYYPEREEFFELLTSSDIFTYTGHGSGSHLMSLEKIQSVHVKAIVLLFGCGSTKIARQGPQVEMFGNYYMYLIARCPCVVGMLFEVTDLDTDVLSTDFMSYWIPSESPVHWKYLDKTKWKKAGEKMDSLQMPVAIEYEKPWEPELLKALNLAKKNLTYYTTKSACVVRGLPVKIQRVS